MRTVTYDEKTHAIVPIELTEGMVQAAGYAENGKWHPSHCTLGDHLYADWRGLKEQAK